jgi:hypothetical protein
MPAPNPCGGLAIFYTGDHGRVSCSEALLLGFPAGTFRAAVNQFVREDDPAVVRRASSR